MEKDLRPKEVELINNLFYALYHLPGNSKNVVKVKKSKFGKKLNSKSEYSTLDYINLGFPHRDYKIRMGGREKIWDDFILPEISKTNLEGIAKTHDSITIITANNYFHSRHTIKGSSKIKLTILSPKLTTFFGPLMGPRVKAKLYRNY